MLPRLHIGDACLPDSAALLLGQVAREHRSNNGFSTHPLLLPDLLHAQPTCGLFTVQGTVKATMRVVANKLFTSVGH